MVMKWIRVPALAGCFAVALSVPALWAQQDTTSGSGQTGGAASTSGTQAQANSTTNAGGMAGADKKFVKEAMEGGMAEVKLGQMASEKGNSPDVKEFGQKMVTDHTKLNDQMKPIASQMGIQPPAELPAKDKALQTKLEGLSGDAFDKAYMSAMVKDHKKDLAEFQKEASSGKNPQVKDAAQQGAQVIQQHLQMAQDVAQKVGAGSGKMGKVGSKMSTNDNKEHQ
jgi:putative membrane protein